MFLECLYSLKMAKNKNFCVSKEDIFNYLAATPIFPGSPNYQEEVRDFIFDCIGISEKLAPNHIVDSVYKQAAIFSAKAHLHWKAYNYDEDQFRHMLMKPKRFLTNKILIPHPYVKETNVPPTKTASKQGRARRGRPNKRFLENKSAANAAAIAKV